MSSLVYYAYYSQQYHEQYSTIRQILYGDYVQLY